MTTPDGYDPVNDFIATGSILCDDCGTRVATTRLIEYQIRERPARVFAKEGNLRLLRRIYRDNGDGSEHWGPWEEVQP